jgi:hypothetical protein
MKKIILMFVLVLATASQGELIVYDSFTAPTNAPATITQVVYSVRTSGTVLQQASARVVLQKTTGEFYISDKSTLVGGRNVFTNGNLAAVNWYAYDPASSMTAIGAPATIDFTNIKAVGDCQKTYRLTRRQGLSRQE